MTKRLLISVLAVILTFTIIPALSTKADAAAINTSYDREAALRYASNHWNDGKGLCAEFAADCLKAGGVTEFYQTRVKPVYDALLEHNYGKSYKLKLYDDSIPKSQNEGKLDAGDLIFYYCNVCGEFTHVSICNGYNAEGFAIEYSHNNAHDGYKRTYTYTHCGSNSWTFYSVKMYDRNTVFGEQTEIAPPQITSISNVKDGVSFNWKAVEGATYYRVYKKTSASGWIFLGKTSNTSYVDTTAENGVEYTYTVRACKGSTFSAYYPGETITFLNTVKLKSATNSGNKIVVKWDKNAQADGYYLYRQVNGGKWSRIASLKSEAIASYTDKNVSSGNVYRYRIRAFKGSCYSAYELAGAKVKCLTAPVLTGVSNCAEGIMVTWKATTGADGYRVYRRAAGERGWTYLQTVEGTQFIDSNVKSGICYRYTVRSASGKTYGSYNSVGLVTRCVSTPVMTGASYTENGVQLTWKPVDGAKGYYVYHKEADAKSWRRIAVLGSETAFIDEKPEQDSTYFYTVRAYYGKTKSSFYKAGLKCICDSSKGVQTTGEPTTETVIPETTVAEAVENFTKAVDISKEIRTPVTLSITNFFINE